MQFLLKSILIIFVTTFLLQANDKVSIQLLWKHQFEFAGFYIAKEKGFYRDAGLEVEIKEFDFGVDIIDDVISGKSDVGIGRSSLILNKLNGKDVVLLNALYQSSPYVLISKKRSDLQTIEDFKDRKIMLSDDLESLAAISSMMRVKDIKETDYTKIPHSFNIDDLINDKVDLMTTYLSNEPFHLEEKGIKFTIFNPKDYGFDFYSDILFTSKQYLQIDSEKIEKFQDASLKGWEYAFSHIDETAELIVRKYNSQNKTKEALIYEANILKKLAYEKDIKLGSLSQQRVEEIANIYRLLGMTNKSNKYLKDLVYKRYTILDTIFRWQFLLGLITLVVIIILVGVLKQYFLKKQNDILESVVADKTKELLEYTHKLEKQKELYDLVFESSSNGVLFIDTQSGKFIECNEQVIQMLKADSKRDVLDIHPSELSPEFQADGRRSDEKVDEMISIVMKEGTNHFKWKYLRLNGEEFWVDVNLTKIILDEREVIYVTWKDIDNEMQAKQELYLLNENLEEKIKSRTKELEFAIRAKSDFLANMSHEIRTPLNGIIGFVDILYKNELDSKKREKLEIIKESGSSLLSIINDILDYSKIEINKLSIEKIPFKIAHIFIHVKDLFFDRAKEKNISINLKIDEKLPQKALGDSSRIKQVFSNLLSNAIKFANKNSTVMVNINYLKDQNKLYCEVIDSGIGITPDKLDSIFNSFEQADNSVSRVYGGTGLGLAISKALVELMGGNIGVDTKEGVGSKFYFTIELFSFEDEITDNKDIDLGGVELKGKALIVEDNKTNQILLSMLLDELNLDSDIANDGIEAVSAVKSKKYDIVLMDENMPNMSGKEATKIIRTLDGLKDIPIVAVTANALKGDRERFLEIGMNDYLSKPIDADELTVVLQKFL